MSTRARIGIVNADKTITSVYTHSDGYISTAVSVASSAYKFSILP